MAQPAPRRSTAPQPSASICAGPSRSAMSQLSASNRSATPEPPYSASAAPRRSTVPQPSAPRRSAVPQPAPRRWAALQPSASVCAGRSPMPQPSASAAPRRSVVPQPPAPRPSAVTQASAPRRSATPQPSASVCADPRRSAMPQPSAFPRSATPKSYASVCAAPRRSAMPKCFASSRSAMPQSGSALPDSVLLDTVVYTGGCCGNETSARAETSDGDPVEVSFLVTDPPALTRCFFYCPVMTAAPEIIAADGAFLLISVFFPHRKFDLRFDVVDFFVYRSGPGTPSLELLPLPNPLANLSWNVGVLSCGEHYLVVDLQLNTPDRMGNNLYVFSSKTKSWTTKLARLASSMDKCRYYKFVPYKVFGVEGASMAWVDLREGILLCNSVAQDPEVQLIQLPALTPVNSVYFGETEMGTMPPLDRIRDVSCNDGWFRFIEIEGLIGWKATMFKRRIHSDKLGWRPCGSFDSAGLSPANSCFPYLYAQKIWDYRKKKLAINSVISSFPALDMCCDDVVYMLAKVKDMDPDGWVLAINTKSKKLQNIIPFSAKSPLISGIFLQCGFSKHLSSVPGACTANGWKDNIKEDLMPYVISSLLVQQKLMQLDKIFTHERPSCDEVKAYTGVASTMNIHIHQVTQFATRNGLGKAALDALNTFERASKDIENMLSQYCYNGPSTCAKAVREKIHVTVETLDGILNMLPSSLLDTGRSIVSVGCTDNKSVVEGSISRVPAPYDLIYYKRVNTNLTESLDEGIIDAARC